MSLDEPIQQILNSLEQKNHALIVTRANASGDCLASSLAIWHLLKKQGKNAEVVIDNAALGLNNKFRFLPGFADISQSVTKQSNITVEFSLPAEEKLKGLTYKIKDNKLLINIDPQSDNLRLSSPQIQTGSYPYDLIISLGSSDLDSLGRIYDDHTDLFYKLPLINIDCQADNEHFGEINLVDMACVSTTEVIFNLIEAWQKSLINEDVATCLLTGIISASKSFQTKNITPRTLAISSELISLGAKRELIVSKIYSNKPINTLQIWGRTLANLKTDPEHGLVWSAIKQADFDQTKTGEEELVSVVDDLLSHVPQAKAVIISFPGQNGQKTIIHTNHFQVDLRKILSPLNPRGSRNLVECVLTETDPEQSINKIKNTLIDRWPKENLMPYF